MNLKKMFKSVLGRASRSGNAEPRSIVILQTKPYIFGEEELRAAAERAWHRKFDGKEDAMYFVSAEHSLLTVVKAGPHIIRLTAVSTRYADNDEYALSQLPQPEQKKAWMEHHACVYLELFNDLSKERKIKDPEAYSSLAKLALQLGDPNCSAIFVPTRNLLFPNDGTAEEGLRMIIDKNLPLKRQ